MPENSQGPSPDGSARSARATTEEHRRLPAILVGLLAGTTVALALLGIGEPPAATEVPATVGSVRTARQQEHPRLVSLEATRCESCHDEQLTGVSVHYPAEDDCTICHEVEIGPDGTTVALMEEDPELCILCHDEMESVVAEEIATPHYPATAACTECHDPHASQQPKLLTHDVPALCSECHDLDDIADSHSGQLHDATNCSSCHDPHGTETAALLRGSEQHAPFADGTCEACHLQPVGERTRLRARGTRLCTTCHANLLDAPDGGSIHPALEDRDTGGCLGCHDPHMSDNDGLAVAEGNALCANCHADVVTAADHETGHYAASDDCMNCHLPHSAPAAHLLEDPVPDLCFMCHDSDDEELVAAHLGADVEALACGSCHTPHGEGNPSLLARTMHPPIEDGCDLCHLGRYDELEDDGESTLCLGCHDDIGEAAAAASVPHEALEVARCVDCHNPHASPEDHLVNAPAGGECLQCHDEMRPGPDEVGHGVIDLIGCRACHEPHGGERDKLLRLEGDELCLACHTQDGVEIDSAAGQATVLDHFVIPQGRVRAMTTLRLSADGEHDHPVAGHRVIGTPTEAELRLTDTAFEGTLSCATCHDPHKGRSSGLFRWDASTATETCIRCHPG